MRESFIFYKSFYEALNDLDEPADKIAFIEAICEYALNEEKPKLSGPLKGMFNLARPQIDKNNIRYENGKKGGAPKGNKNAKKQPKTTENNQNLPNVNVNDNVNVNVNDNDNVNGADKSGSFSSFSIINYLNQKIGGNHKATDKTDALVSDLLGSGYTESDLYAVIDKKVADWRDVPKMRGYLRPSTLFGPKFAEYLGEPDTMEAEETAKRRTSIADLKKQIHEKAEALRVVREQLDKLGVSPDDREKYGQLRESEELLLKVLAQMNRRLEKLETEGVPNDY